MQPTTATTDHAADPVDYARPTVAAVRAALAQLHQLRQGAPAPARWRPGGRHHTRAGVTKRHGRGTPKSKRKMAAQSRRRNRKKRTQ